MFIAYLYDRHYTLKTTIFDLFEINIMTQISESASSRFKLHHTNSNCRQDLLVPYSKIRIFQVENGTETLYFDGFLEKIEANLEHCELFLQDNLALLKKRVFHENLFYTQTPLKEILEDLMTKTNLEDDMKIRVESDVDALYTLDIFSGEVFFDVLQNLAQGGYEFQIDGNVLRFGEQIGQDRTSGENALEYRYDATLERERTIRAIDFSSDGDQLFNGVVCFRRGVTYSNFDHDSMQKFGLLELSHRLKKGTGNISTDLINEYKDLKKTFSLTPVSSNFLEASVGDIVKIFVNVGNDLFSIDENLKILGKSFASRTGKITFQIGKIETKSVYDRIKQMQLGIRNLEFED